MKVALKRTAIATSTVAWVALLSFSWSEQRGVSLGIESAHGADQSSVGVARRQYRRSGNELFVEAVASTSSTAAIACSHGTAANHNCILPLGRSSVLTCTT